MRPIKENLKVDKIYVITKYVAYYIFIIIDDYQLIAAALRG